MKNQMTPHFVVAADFRIPASFLQMVLILYRNVNFAAAVGASAAMKFVSNMATPVYVMFEL